MRYKGLAFILFNLLCLLVNVPASAQLTDTTKSTSDTASLPTAESSKTSPDPLLTPPVNLKAKYQVRGTIKDKNNGEPVAYALVFLANSTIGTTADEQGNFLLAFDKMTQDSLRVTALGYKTFTQKLSKDVTKPTLMIGLEPVNNTLNEVVIQAGEDPAVILFRNIVRRQPVNDPERIENYRCEAYNKLEVDVLDFTKKTFEALPVPGLKKFSFVYNIVDSFSEDRPFLPFFLTESLSDFYYRKSPKRQREFIKASMVRGVENQSITKYLGTVYQKFNPYDDYLPVLQKRFIGPLNNAGLLYYHYRILDTIKVAGQNVIHMSYRPRRPEELCFTGELWVVDSIYALHKIEMSIPRNVNLNWVKRVSVSQEFLPVSDSVWFLSKEKFLAEFQTPVDIKLPATIARKTTSYKNVVVNDSHNEEVLDDKRYKLDVIVADSARYMSDAYWSTARHEELNKNEKGIYNMIDTLTSLESFKRFKGLVRFFTGGMVRLGYIELGPYWKTYSYNGIEGHRFSFGLANTQKLFKNAYLTAYGAYGTQDKKYKYGLTGLWLFDRLPRTYVYASYTSDLDFTDNYYDQNQVLGANNLFSFAIRKPNIPVKLAFTKRAEFEFYREYYSGFSHRLFLYYKDFQPYAPLPAVGVFTDASGAPSLSAVSAEVGVKLRYAYKEKFVEGRYYRVSLGSKYPIADVSYSRGIKDFLNSSYSYDKIKASISGTVKTPPFGKIYISVFGGKYFGVLPYPLLEVHPGNEYYYYNQFVFNMMNRYEFISDEYVGFNIEHSLGGGLFTYIPLLKKTKFRQFWTAKGIIGSLSDENKKLNLDKGYTFKTLENNPYIELGTGIENILKVFRVDFIWRVTPKPLPTEARQSYFGVFGSLRLTF